jgi:hypothetical protein
MRNKVSLVDLLIPLAYFVCSLGLAMLFAKVLHCGSLTSFFLGFILGVPVVLGSLSFLTYVHQRTKGRQH